MEQFIWSIPEFNNTRPYTTLPKDTSVEFYVTANSDSGMINTILTLTTTETVTYIWDVLVKLDVQYVEWCTKCGAYPRFLYIESGKYGESQLPGVDTQSFQFQYGT